MTDYQPRTPGRIIEILNAQDENPRSWQREAATLIEELEGRLANANKAKAAFCEAWAQNIALYVAAQERALAAESSLSRIEAETRERWQPIETAPKDGTKIIYHNGQSVDAVIGYCRWSDWSFEHQEEESQDACWWDYERDYEACPKWWMPEISLPAPPIRSLTPDEGDLTKTAESNHFPSTLNTRTE